MPRLALVTFLVPDYSQGIAFFVDGLGWRLVTDEDQGNGKRWVTVAPEAGGPALLLARATTEAQRTATGQQTGDRVAFFLHCDEFASEAARIEITTADRDPFTD